MPLIETKSADGCLVIRFANGAARNSLSTEVLRLLEDELARVETDDRLERVIFTGEGDVFASGADLREISGVTAEGSVEFALRGQRLMKRIAALESTTVAAVNGYCF